MQTYKFYNFIQTLLPTGNTPVQVTSGIYLIHSITADQPLRAFNEFCKAHGHSFDFLVENGTQAYVRNGIQFVPVTFKQLSVAYEEQSKIKFLITDESFERVISQ